MAGWRRRNRQGGPRENGVHGDEAGIGAFIVPYIFVYNPAMLLIGTTPFTLIQNLITARCGMFGMGAAMIGYCLAPMRWWERIGFGATGLMLIGPATWTDITGITLLGIGLLYPWRKSKQRSKSLSAAEQA